MTTSSLSLALVAVSLLMTTIHGSRRGPDCEYPPRLLEQTRSALA